MSENPNITWEIVKNNPTKPWSYTKLINNPNITWEIVNEQNKLNSFQNFYIDNNIFFIKYNRFYYYNILSDEKKKMLKILKNDKNIMFFCYNLISFNKTHIEDIKKISEHILYFKTNVIEELMIFVWKPSRYDFWKNYDSDIISF